MGKSNIILADKKGYKLNKKGEVIGIYGSVLSLQLNNKGYLYFNIRDGGKKCVKVLVHRFRAYKKFGDKMFKKGIVVRHLDGNPLNNDWDNIDIGTQSENMLDRPKEELYKQAVKASLYAKVHEHEDIIKYYEKCKSYKKTMKEFNITSKGTLHFIINNSIEAKN